MAAILALTLGGRAIAAQSITTTRAGATAPGATRAPADIRVVEPRPAVRRTSVIAAGSVAGLAVSAALIQAAYRNCGEYDYHCIIPYLVQPLGAPLGAHLANRRLGSLGASVARSYLASGFGLLVGAALGAEEAELGWPVTAGVIGVWQVLLSVAVERSSSFRD